MKINACSVAFRHMNITAAFLATYVRNAEFDGLEIWAQHARAFAADWAGLPWRPRVPMLAGYLPLGEDHFTAADALDLCQLARVWQADRIRLFAGTTASELVGTAHRKRILADLRLCGNLAEHYGLAIAVEFHPDTLADSLSATQSLLDAVNHPAIGINFDVLHVWESGADPTEAYRALATHVRHFHLKSVTSRAHLPVFAPANIHDPRGSRDGLCPLFDGLLDYVDFLTSIPENAETSLEWFGNAPAETMLADLRKAKQLFTTEIPT